MEKKYFAINWTDGVKITKDHFIESDAHMINVVRDMGAISLTSYNFGLLEPLEGTEDSVKISALANTSERLTLALEHCNAVTRKGSRICYKPDFYGDEKPTASVESTHFEANSDLEFLVIVTVNPFEMVPVGEPDPEAIPLHHPYALPKIDLQIVSKDQFNANYLQSNFLIISNVFWRNGAFLLGNDFMPPTSQLKYIKKLQIFLQNINNIFTQLRNNSINIHHKNRLKYSTNKLAANTYELCVKVLEFIGQNQFFFNQIAAEKEPIQLFNRIAILASYLSTALDLLDPKDKESLLQYYYEWIDIKPSELEAAIGEVVEMQYNHLEIYVSFKKINTFMAIINRLWQKMASLEYIGQRKDNIVISEDTLAVKPQQQKPSWSIID